ncbi:uncharacterized protein LOC105848551 isoform X2 [Hydra vulgaris]|uniref:uncharacterized protein LOC105848551 isoform X2 n=1 Tax=Hydra vulgaris TaxID=6087 RepID=UPI001F5E82A3|nr:uncharacterized protein LOC105848551 isoform X2 [Hydra vulgaris]
MKIVSLAIFFASIYLVKSASLNIFASKTDLKEGDNVTITTQVLNIPDNQIGFIKWFYNESIFIATAASPSSFTVVPEGRIIFGDRVSASHQLNSGYLLNFYNLRANDSTVFTVTLMQQIGTIVNFINKNFTLDVKADPVILSFPEVLFVNDGNELFVELTVYGRPKPSSKITHANQAFNANSYIDFTNNMYKYVYNLSAFYAKDCGSVLLLDVSGNGITVYRNTTIFVQFTPGLISLSSPVVQLENFFIYLNWNPVPSGACSVTYNIEFINNTNQIVNQFSEINTTSFSAANNANATYFRIYAVYNGTPGIAFNQTIPNPQSTTTTTTTAVKITIPSLKPEISARQANTGLGTGVVIGIAVGAVVFILLIGIIIVVIVKKRPNKSIKPDAFPLKDKRKSSDEKDYPPSKKTQDPDQMIYAQLGAGGGRTGPKPNPINSNYAEIKVDDMGYPARGPTSDRLPSNPPPYDDVSRRYSRPPSETFDDGIIV